MGMRQAVQVQFPARDEHKREDMGNSIYIYSHWGGDDDVNNSPLAQQVRAALAKRERWDDESYLCRMIISQIVKDAGIDDPTGVGIAPDDGYLDEEFPRIVVDLAAQTVNGIAYDKFITLYD